MITKIVLKYFFGILVCLSLLFSILVTVSDYLALSLNNFEMLKNAFNVFVYYILNFINNVSISFIYVLIFTVILFYYYFHQNIKKRIILSGYNYKKYCYLVMIISAILIFLNFILYETYIIELKCKADNMLYWQSGSYNNPAIFIDNKRFLFIKDYYVENNKEKYYRNIILDDLNNKEPNIIYAKAMRIKKNKLELFNGLKSYIRNNKIVEESFEKIEITFNPKKLYNIFSKKLYNLSVFDLDNNISMSPYNTTDFILVLRNLRYISLINNILFIIFVHLLFLNFNFNNVFMPYLIAFLLILVNSIIEYFVKDIFINLSLSNNFYILVEFIILFILGVFVLFITRFFNRIKQIFNNINKQDDK